MRARSGCAGCAVAARATCDALLIQLKLEVDVPRHGLSLLAFRRDRNLGLGRSCPVAFGRTKNISRARPAHRARDAARAPRGRGAVRQTCVFEAPAPQDCGARTVRKGGRRPPASVASGTGLPNGACEAGSGGGRARTPSVARLGAASRVRSRSSVAASRKPALRPNGFTYC